MALANLGQEGAPLDQAQLGLGIGSGLQGIVNGYLQALQIKHMQQADQLEKAKSSSSFGFDPTTLTGDDWAKAFKNADPNSEDPHARWAGIMMRSAGLDYSGKKASVEKDVQEGREKKILNDMIDPQAAAPQNPLGGSNPSSAPNATTPAPGNLITRMAGQGVPLSVFANAAGRNQPLKMAYLNEVSKQPGAALANELKYKTSESKAALGGGADVQLPVRLIESVKPTLAGLASSANKIGMGDNLPSNAAHGFWNTSIKANDAYTSHVEKVTEARKQVASVLAGNKAAKESDNEDAARVIPMWAPAHVYANAVNTTIPQLLEQRKNALLELPMEKQKSDLSDIIRAGIAAGKSRDEIKAMLKKNDPDAE